MKRTANGSYFGVIGRLSISDYKDRIIQASPVDEDGDLFLCEIREEHEPEEKKELKDITLAYITRRCQEHKLIYGDCKSCDLFKICRNMKMFDPNEWSFK